MFGRTRKRKGEIGQLKRRVSMNWPGCLRLFMRLCRLRILLVFLVLHLAWWVQEAISYEPADGYWDCGNQEGMESGADDVESQRVGMAGDTYRE